MLQKYFPIQKNFLIDAHTKIWTEITDIIVFRKKLLEFLQSELNSSVGFCTNQKEKLGH